MVDPSRTRSCPNVLAAVLEHYRWWVATDGFDLLRFRDGQPAQADGDYMRSFASRYKVGRGLKSGQQAKYLSLIEREVRRDWPAGLKKRAARTVNISEIALKHGFTSGLTVSMASKLIWHFKPEKWTIFDKYAADAVLGANNARSSIRIVNFFERLEELNFDRVIEQMNRAKMELGLECLWSERIFDKWLLRVADKEGNIFPMPDSSFVNIVGTERFGKLESLAKALEPILPTKELAS